MTPSVTTQVQVLNEFKSGELHDLCDATEAAILDGGGFGWLAPPARQVLENYWKGLLLVPERILFAARLDGVICGTAQLHKPPRNNEAQAFAAHLVSAFISPWARGHGLARQLTEYVEDKAFESGFDVLTLDVRETQTAAIKLYESMGYVRWGTNPHYARADRTQVAGHFYYKELRGAAKPQAKGAGKAQPVSP